MCAARGGAGTRAPAGAGGRRGTAVTLDPSRQQPRRRATRGTPGFPPPPPATSPGSLCRRLLAGRRTGGAFPLTPLFPRGPRAPGAHGAERGAAATRGGEACSGAVVSRRPPPGLSCPGVSAPRATRPRPRPPRETHRQGEGRDRPLGGEGRRGPGWGTGTRPGSPRPPPAPRLTTTRQRHGTQPPPKHNPGDRQGRGWREGSPQREPQQPPPSSRALASLSLPRRRRHPPPPPRRPLGSRPHAPPTVPARSRRGEAGRGWAGSRGDRVGGRRRPPSLPLGGRSVRTTDLAREPPAAPPPGREAGTRLPGGGD